VSMGVAVCAGMTIATLFGVFIIPVLFVAVERLAMRFSRSPKKAPAAAPPPAPAKPVQEPGE